MSLLLALASLAHATSYTETYAGSASGGNSVLDDFRANHFVAESTIQITGLSAYAEANSWSAPCTLYAYLWREPTTGSTWTATLLGSVVVPYTGAGPSEVTFTMASTPTITAGSEVMIGFYSPDNIQLYYSGSTTVPAWATMDGSYFLNYATGSSSRDWTSPGYFATFWWRSTLTFTAPDADRDGYDTLTDCNDAAATTYPGARDAWYDGVDSDCAGNDDDDQDADGHTAAARGGDDCDDTRAAVHPGVTDVWYDGVDSDCGGEDDYDQDDDGARAASGGGRDCDDTDADVYPGAIDTFYDGVDADCVGNDDYDMDGDGHRARGYGGDDCNDGDGTVYPGAPDRDYDGIDSDCASDSDFDRDGDGHESAVYGGDDCDDLDAGTWTGCPEDTGGGDTGTVDTGGGSDTGTQDTGTTDTSSEDTADTGDAPTITGRRREKADEGGCNASGHGVSAASWLVVLAGAVGLRRRRR